MSKNEFEVTKLTKEKITVEEQIDQKKNWFLTFWRKYGNILTIILIFLAITIFTIGMGIALSNFLDNANETHEISVKTLVEYINGDDLEVINTYPMTEIQADTLFDNKKYKESTFIVTNYSDVKVNCKIEIIDETEQAKAITKDKLKYKISKNGIYFPSKQLQLNEGVGELLITDLEIGSKNNFILRMWLDETASNNEQKKEFKGKIKVYFEYIEE